MKRLFVSFWGVAEVGSNLLCQLMMLCQTLEIVGKGEVDCFTARL